MAVHNKPALAIRMKTGTLHKGGSMIGFQNQGRVLLSETTVTGGLLLMTYARRRPRFSDAFHILRPGSIHIFGKLYVIKASFSGGCKVLVRVCSLILDFSYLFVFPS
jgi:hypothetical protein